MSTSTAAKCPNNYFDGLEVTGKHQGIFFIIMMAYFFEQMDNWNFGFIAPAIFKSWGLTPEAANVAMGDIGFWYFIGMTLGGFMGGIISDFIGRRKTFLLSMVLFSICSIINGLPIENVHIFILARALTGFGVFCLMVCSQAYIAEMAPAESRGKWQGLVAAVGFAAVPVIAFLCRVIVPLHPEAWRIIFFLGGLGLIGYLIAHKYLLESPRWLVSQGRIAEAEDIVEKITHRRVDLSGCANHRPEKTSVMEAVTGMFAPQYLGRTLLLLFTFLTITPAGFAFTFWTGKLLSDVYSQENMLTLTTIISCGVPAGCFLASRISDMGGRKIPLAVMYAGAAILAFAFGRFSDNFIITAILGFGVSVFNLAGSFILFSYCAESYPTKLRNTATGLHNGLARLSVSVFQKVIPMIMVSIGGAGGIFGSDMAAVFTVISVLFALCVPFVFLFGMRTGGRSLEEIS